MNKFSWLFALIIGALVSFTSCDDDELTPEELEAKQSKELVDQIAETYGSVTAEKWELKTFEGSESLITAAATEDDALNIINKAKYAQELNMVLSFAENGELFNPAVAINVPEEDLEQKILDILNAPYIEAWGFAIFSELSESDLLSHLADYRRVLAAPFAADALTIDQITNDETGRCIFSIGLKDYTALSYDDVILNQKKFIEGNTDKIYFNEDGTLTVEATNEKYGVSKYIYSKVTE